MIIFRKGIIKNQGKIKILRYVKRGMPEGKKLEKFLLHVLSNLGVCRGVRLRSHTSYDKACK